MIGRNPKTGQPIRIMKSESSIWKNQKTIVWLREDLQDTTMDRWETVCTSLTEYNNALEKNINVDALILLENSQEEIQFLQKNKSNTSNKANDIKILLVSRKLVARMGEQAFEALRLGNVICLEEIHEIFPFVGNTEPWNETREDALHLLALVLRMHKIVGLSSEQLNPKRTSLDCSKNEKPAELWYITQYYIPTVAKRASEIKRCLDENLKCPYIDKVILLNENIYSNLTKETETKTGKNKLIQINHGKRLTYSAVLQWFKENAPENTFCVFANADIYLDDSWRSLWTTRLTDKFLSLLRYDVQPGGKEPVLFGPRPDSQDTWVVHSDSLKSRTFDWTALDFPFGQAGCDNAINVEMLKKRFLVINPALTLKTNHLHMSDVRTYDPSNIVDRPMYLYIEPTGIHDMEPITNLSPYQVKTVEIKSFTRKVSSVSEQNMDTLCTMLKRDEVYDFDRHSANETTKDAIQIYKYENCFTTVTGLVYGTHRILVGDTEASRTSWAEARISPLAPSFFTKKTLCAQLTPAMLKTPEAYMLQYISKILLMRKEVGSGDFWAPQNSAFTEPLQIFNWGESNTVPVLPIAMQAQVWSSEVYQWSVKDTKDLITKEQIDCLRESLFAPWLQMKEDNVESAEYVIVADDFCDIEWTQSFEQQNNTSVKYIYSGRTSAVSMYEKLRGAKGLIFRGGPNTITKWAWMWMLPSNATIIEIQNEMEPCGDVIHMAGACGLTYHLVSVPRAKLDFQKKESLRLVLETIQQKTIDLQTDQDLPIIYMPRKSLTGLFGHAGDSCRELIRLWADKKFVRLEEHPTATQIWLHGVGDTLLYDRPTMEWFQSAPDEEQVYKRALFGNPAPPINTNAHTWTFWARRPELLEEKVRENQYKGYTERTEQLVFYGKIENKIQEKRRTTADWASVCSDFSMPITKTDTYPFTPLEYLDKLGNAKFGLCLAGFGKKCHREVECMALGTVPIVHTDVDMIHYYDAPQENIHYLRVKTPEEALEKITALSEEKWTEMSTACRTWWQKNCSVEGSWGLTKMLAMSKEV